MSQRKGTVDSTGSPSACPPHVDEFGFFILPSKTSLSNMLPTPPPAPTEAPTIKRAWTMRRTLTDASRPLDDIPKRSSSAFHLAGPSKTAVDASTAAHATAERLYDAASSSNTKLQDAAEMGSMPQIPSYLRKKRPSVGGASLLHTFALSKANAAMVEREKAWLKLLELPSMKGVNNLKQVKRLCREGLPSSLRGKIWTKLILEGRQREPELFDALMTKQNAMVDTNIDIFDVIERDVMRCYPQHSMFSDYEGHGVRNLRGILRCYALYNPLLGYTQGMGFIVGMLMMHITSTEDVFWVLVGMLEGVCKGFYDPDLKRVRMDARVFDVLLRNMDTKLSIYFETNQIDGLMFIPQWFLTLFTSCLPWPSVLRIWDMFICEGSKALFRMSLALLIASKEHLLMRCPSNSEALSFILHLPRDDPKFQPEALSKLMMKIRLRSRNLQKLRLHVEENTDSRGRNI